MQQKQEQRTSRKASGMAARSGGGREVSRESWKRCRKAAMSICSPTAHAPRRPAASTPAINAVLSNVRPAFSMCPSTCTWATGAMICGSAPEALCGAHRRMPVTRVAGERRRHHLKRSVDVALLGEGCDCGTVGDGVRLDAHGHHAVEDGAGSRSIARTACGHQRSVAEWKVGGEAKGRGCVEDGKGLCVAPALARVAQQLGERWQTERELRGGVGERMYDRGQRGRGLVQLLRKAAHMPHMRVRFHVAAQSHCMAAAARMQHMQTMRRRGPECADKAKRGQPELALRTRWGRTTPNT